MESNSQYSGSSRSVPPSTVWEGKRVLIAALFLPVSSNCKKTVSTTSYSSHSSTSTTSTSSTHQHSSSSSKLSNPVSTTLASLKGNPLKTPPPESFIASLEEQKKAPFPSTPSSKLLFPPATGAGNGGMGTPKSPPQLLDPVETIFYPSNAGNPGLYNAITSLKDHMGPVEWVGTTGCSTDHLDEKDRAMFTERMIRDHSSVPVFVSDAQMEGHYHQFCKQILWKPFHYQLPDYPKPKGFEESAWKCYCEVNQLFADNIVARYRPDDVVWINDYHLMLVPEMVRKQLPNATIGFFLHIPFPSSEIFRCLPMRKRILNGLLGADLIGFQIYAFMRHFLMTCSRLLALDSTPKAILLENSTVAVGSYPIGIDLVALDHKRKDPEVLKLVAVLKEKYAGKYVVIGRDKNDYVKGVRHKLLAFERFLQIHPEMQGKVVLIQVSLSTSEANESQSNVSNVAARINSSFGTIEYVPVVYLHQDISFNYYLALLSVADASLITSLRDGMNLTSHEYVVCQEEKKSPLIISEFAGTYGNFSAALRVNPWDTQEVADAIYEALVMNEEDKAYRWKNLYSYVNTNTAPQFVRTFLSDLVARHEENVLALSTSIPKLSLDMLQTAYNASSKRIILLDDDGTLQQPASSLRTSDTSEEAMISVLTKLCSVETNCVYLMSSRSRAEVEYLFTLLPNLGISAESGCFIRFPFRSHWEALFNETDMSWRKKVLEIFQYYTDRTPGSSIEEKEIGLAWHYEFADLKYGEWQAAECQNHMTVSLPNFPIHIMSRKKCIEVYLRNVSKATAIRRILQHHQNKARRASSVVEGDSPGSVNNQELLPNHGFDAPSVTDFCDFILCIGDDRADEYMFQYLRKLSKRKASISEGKVARGGIQEQASEASFMDPSLPDYPYSLRRNSFSQDSINIFTCTVGSKSSAAKWYLPTPAEVVSILSSL